VSQTKRFPDTASRLVRVTTSISVGLGAPGRVSEMKPAGPATQQRRTLRVSTLLVVSLAVALSIAVGAAAVEANLASQYHSRLAGISPCDGGGFGVSASCPPAVGATFEQIGHGILVNGSFEYSLLIAPQFPPEVNSSDITARVFNATTNVTMTLLNVTLSASNGSPLARYHSVDGTWETPTVAEILSVDLLSLYASLNASGDRVLIWDSAAGNGAEIPLE